MNLVMLREEGSKLFMISLYKYNRYFSHSIVPKHRQATSTDFRWKQQTLPHYKISLAVLDLLQDSILLGEGNGIPLQYSCLKFHGRRSLVGCSPWGRWGSDMTEQLHFYFSLLCIGEGNGNPLQCSCLENPRDGGAWWATVYGVTQSRTRLKRLSSSSSRALYLQILTW